MAKTGHPNFDYTCQAYWRGVLHNFSITGNHSGTSFGAGDAQTFMEGDSSPYALSFAPFQSTEVKVVQSRYYDGQNSAPVYDAVYTTENPAPSPLTPTGAAYESGGGEVTLPLEVCVMLEAQCGMSSTSKPIYLRKYLRATPLAGLGTGPDEEAIFEYVDTISTITATLSNGDWYGNRIYISPNARQPTGSWEAITFPYAHQVPRGRKRKTAATSSNLLNDALKLAAAAAAGAAADAAAL